MPRSLACAFLGPALVLVGAACAGAAGPPPANAPIAALASPGVSRPASPGPSPSPVRTATPVRVNGPTFILIRAPDLTAGARLNFQGQGFEASEQTAVTIEDARGAVESPLDPVTISKDGNLDEVSVVVPDGIGRGEHVLHVAGASSGRSARAKFTVRYITPRIALDTYSAKSNHTFGFTGSGFAPNEPVDVRLGGLGGSPLASFPSDAQGNVTAQEVPLPLIQAGDYLLYFVGEQSQTPVSIGFNVQGFAPWVVLDTYSAAPYSAMGFTGQDFVPGEPIAVYLDQRTAHLELTNYAGRPGTPIAFKGSGWARNENLRASIGEGSAQEASFRADAGGAFDAAGGFRLPIGTVAGGVPVTVRGDVSQAEVTLWYQALDLKPSAELTAYQGPPGTVVSFTGRSFAGGERVSVYLQDRGGTKLASAFASDDGTVEGISSYPIQGNWGDDIHFVLVGDDSHSEGTTDFKIANP